MQLKKIVLFCCFIGVVSSSFADEKTTYGLHEKVQIMDLNGMLVAAKLDTGARNASLSAVDIELFTKDNKNWVRFSPLIEGKKFKTMERPVVKLAKIKRRVGDCPSDEDREDDESSSKNDAVKDNDTNKPEYAYRPEIQMQVCLGNSLKTIDVNLTDRSSFKFPLLIGAKALNKFNALVDPSVDYQSKASCSVK